MPYPIILIIIDQLTSLKYINPKCLDSLTGIQKFKKAGIYFDNYYTNAVPCSAARSVIYTGTHTNITRITENIEIAWQKTLSTPSEGLDNLASYVKKNNYLTRYIGKAHLVKNLVPNDFIKSKPKLSTEYFLKEYHFDKYNKFGDYCFDSRLGFYNDSLVTSEILPLGTIEETADLYDHIQQIALDGLIPFLTSQKSNNNFLVCANYDNPHDILYTNITTDIKNLQSPSIQINGLDLQTQLKNNI